MDAGTSSAHAGEVENELSCYARPCSPCQFGEEALRDYLQRVKALFYPGHSHRHVHHCKDIRDCHADSASAYPHFEVA